MSSRLQPYSLSPFFSLSLHYPLEQSQRRTLIGLAWVKCPTIEPIIPIHGRRHDDKRELPESPADPSPPTMWRITEMAVSLEDMKKVTFSKGESDTVQTNRTNVHDN